MKKKKTAVLYIDPPPQIGDTKFYEIRFDYTGLDLSLEISPSVTINHSKECKHNNGNSHSDSDAEELSESCFLRNKS